MVWLFRHEVRFLSFWTSLSWPGTWNILHSLLCLHLWVGWDLGFRVEVTSVVRKKRAQLCGMFCFVLLPVQGLFLTWTAACFPLDFWSGFIGFLRALCGQSLQRCGLWTVCCTFANLRLLLFLSFIYLFVKGRRDRGNAWEREKIWCVNVALLIEWDWDLPRCASELKPAQFVLSTSWALARSSWALVLA